MKTNLYTYTNFSLLPGMNTEVENGGDPFIKAGTTSFPTELMRIQLKRGASPEIIGNTVFLGSFMKISGEKFILLTNEIARCRKYARYVLVKYPSCNLIKGATLVKQQENENMYALVELLHESRFTIYNKNENRFYGIANHKGVLTETKSPVLT